VREVAEGGLVFFAGDFLCTTIVRCLTIGFTALGLGELDGEGADAALGVPTPQPTETAVIPATKEAARPPAAASAVFLFI
jgi:hypothetical protein